MYYELVLINIFTLFNFWNTFLYATKTYFLTYHIFGSLNCRNKFEKGSSPNINENPLIKIGDFIFSVTMILLIHPFKSGGHLKQATKISWNKDKFLSTLPPPTLLSQNAIHCSFPLLYLIGHPNTVAATDIGGKVFGLMWIEFLATSGPKFGYHMKSIVFPELTL